MAFGIDSSSACARRRVERRESAIAILGAAGLRMTNGMYGLFISRVPPPERRAFMASCQSHWRAEVSQSHPKFGFASVHFVQPRASVARACSCSIPGIDTMDRDRRASADQRRHLLRYRAGRPRQEAAAYFGERRTLVTVCSSTAGISRSRSVQPVVWLGIPFRRCGACGPSAQGLMTRRVQPNERGRLQGALSASPAPGIVGPVCFRLRSRRR
jgi:hypothetical protein